MLAKCRNNALVARVLSQNVLDNDNHLLDNIVDLGRDEILEGCNTLLGGILNLDGYLANCLDGSSDEIHIDFKGILLQLSEELFIVMLVCYPNHDFQLLKLNIGRISVFAEEDAHLLAQNVWFSLEQEINVSQSDVLDLRLRSNQGNWIRSVWNLNIS
jgi:hypothetical protein